MVLQQCPLHVGTESMEYVFVVALPLSPDPFPQVMVMQDTVEPESAKVDATGSGDGGSGSASQVGDPFRYLSACRCSIPNIVTCIYFQT